MEVESCDELDYQAIFDILADLIRGATAARLSIDIKRVEAYVTILDDQCNSISPPQRLRHLQEAALEFTVQVLIDSIDAPPTLATVTSIVTDSIDDMNKNLQSLGSSIDPSSVSAEFLSADETLPPLEFIPTTASPTATPTVHSKKRKASKGAKKKKKGKKDKRDKSEKS